MPGLSPTAVLFDWDNTLVDNWPAIAQALNVVFRRRSMPQWTVAETQANVRGSARDSFPALFGAGWQQDAALFYATLADHHLDHLHPLPGVLPLLDAASARPCAVVSNKAGTLLRLQVAHLGWTARFGAIVGAADAAADKPNAAPLLMALATLGIPPGPAVWYVGDTALDMHAARAAGCRAVLVGDAAHDGGATAAAPDAQFADAATLATAITKACTRPSP